MSSQIPELSPERWRRVQTLFEEMLDSSDPWDLLAREPDSQVAAATERLFRNHHRASAAHFLDEPITLVRTLTSAEPARFASGQVLAGRFIVERLLGRGGMGEVYLARDERLNEVVAVKTIRGSLTQDAGIRRRFFAEIQNARRVTHRNVCRIFDLFEEGDTAFFSMEYLEGIGLSEWVVQHSGPSMVRRRVAIELAEGLNAAHRNGILHCDFKPANVVLTGDPSDPRPVITDFGLARALSGATVPNVLSLQAGTLGYMAPELIAGGPATVRSDIFAYGMMLLDLLPDHRMGRRCAAALPENRPESLDEVIRELRGGATRRIWMMGAAAAPFAAFAAYEMWSRPKLALVSRQRLAFNGFRPEQANRASLLRDLLITALRQSLLVSVVPDDRVRSALGELKFPAKLPADRQNLLAAAVHGGFALVAEGTVIETGRSLRFLLQVFQAGDPKPALEISQQASSEGDTVQLAERVVLQLRRELGESPAALKSGYAPLQQLTSPYPEAASYYFNGVRLYENAEAESAIAWFDNAIRIDPQFALAHLSRGLALVARFEAKAAMPSYKKALDLSGRVSERERLWIEAGYYNVTVDFVSSLDTCRRLVALYPDDAVFQRQAAFAYAATGRPADALPFTRRAVELDPTSVNNASELIVNHAEANLNDEALQLHQQFRTGGMTSTLLDRGAGLAWMGKGELDKAREMFEWMGQDAKRERWSRLLRWAPAILQGSFAEAARTLDSDLAWDVAMNEQNHRRTRRIWLANLELLMDAPRRALFHAEELVGLEPLPVVLDQIRDGALVALSAAEPELAQLALERLRSIEREYPSTHSKGVRALVESGLLPDRDRGDLLNMAVGLWPDPPALFIQAQWLARRGEFASALAVCETMERQRGRILKRCFPGLVVQGWIEQARYLAAVSRFADALRLYERVRQYWMTGPKEFTITHEVRKEIENLERKRRATHG